MTGSQGDVQSAFAGLVNTPPVAEVSFLLVEREEEVLVVHGCVHQQAWEEMC